MLFYRLEDQLLAEVVKAERPDLEKSKSDLTVQQNSFKISLKSLEDDLLARLSSAGENVLDDPTLVLNLEKTKKTAAEIELKVAESRITSLKLDTARVRHKYNLKSILFIILPSIVGTLSGSRGEIVNTLLYIKRPNEDKQDVSVFVESFHYRF